jgi:hypothetical protein
MWKSVFRWLLKSVDISVSVEDGVIRVQLFFMDQLVFSYDFDLHGVSGSSTSAVLRRIGK